MMNKLVKTTGAIVVALVAGAVIGNVLDRVGVDAAVIGAVVACGYAAFTLEKRKKTICE